MVVGSGGDVVVLRVVGWVGATVVSIVRAAGSSNAGAGAGASPSNAASSYITMKDICFNVLSPGGGAGASTATFALSLFSVRSIMMSLCTGTNLPSSALPGSEST